MYYKARNKRLIARAGNGKFRKTTMQDVGIGGVCEKCNHFLVRHYDGDESEAFLDPRNFRYRCFTCEPRTESEQRKLQEKIDAEKEKNSQFWATLNRLVEDEGR